jgi:hypothetical protein
MLEGQGFLYTGVQKANLVRVPAEIGHLIRRKPAT